MFHQSIALFILLSIHSEQKKFLPPIGVIVQHYWVNNVNLNGLFLGCANKDTLPISVMSMFERHLPQSGYRYIILDHRWETHPSNKNPPVWTADPDRIVNGMINISLYLHDKRMHLGLRLGNNDDYLNLGIKNMIEWPVDYVLIDTNAQAAEKDIGQMHQLVTEWRRYGRNPFVACNGNSAVSEVRQDEVDWVRAKRECDSWNPNPWTNVLWEGILNKIRFMKTNSILFSSLAEPGFRFDLGPMTVGYRLRLDEEQTQMAMWSMFSSPLFIQFGVYSPDYDALEILRNQRLIKINQDTGGRMPKFISIKSDVQLWSRELFDTPDTWAIAFMNEADEARRISVLLYEMLIRRVGTCSMSYILTDVFTGDELAPTHLWIAFEVDVAPHGTKMYHVRNECT